MDEEQIDHKELRIRLLKKTIFGQMAAIEQRRKKLFHEIDPALDGEIALAMENNTPAALNRIIKELDEMAAK